MLQPQSNTPPPDDLMTGPEVAALFRVDDKTPTRWAAAGRFGGDAFKTPGGQWRFRAARVRALFEATS